MYRSSGYSSLCTTKTHLCPAAFVLPAFGGVLEGVQLVMLQGGGLWALPGGNSAPLQSQGGHTVKAQCVTWCGGTRERLEVLAVTTCRWRSLA